MTLQTVNVKLPRAVYRRLEQIATTTHQSVDRVLLQTIRGNLPPALDDIPARYRDDLRGLLGLRDDDLWAIARAPLHARKWRRHQRLLEKNSTADLNARERVELEHLRAEMDLQILRQSFALALLKWRGHSISNREVGRATT